MGVKERAVPRPGATDMFLTRFEIVSKAAHLGSGVLGGEPAVDCSSGVVASRLAVADVSLQGVFIRVSPLETGPGQHAELDFCHVQPAAMLGDPPGVQTPPTRL